MTEPEKLPSINTQHRFRLRTLTPVSIGADEADALSPYADYVLSPDGKQIYYLDQRKVEKAVLAAGLLDEYVTSIANRMDNNRSDFDLDQFLRNRLKLDPKTVARTIAPNHGLSRNNRLNINAIVKDAARPYLPGSSLKGAFRTAMLYDWLAQTKAGEPELKKYVAALPELERAGAEVSRLKKIFKQQRLFREFDAAKRTLAEAEKKFFKEENLFGKLNDGPLARFIRVTDSTFASESKLGVYATRRIRLQPNPKVQGRERDIPTPREAIAAGAVLEFGVSVPTQGLADHPLAYWAEKSTAEVLTLLSQFSKACIDNELYEIRQADNRNFQKDIDALEDFYADLQNRAAQGEVFLRLGFGKTVFDNSLALTFLNGIADGKDAEDAFMDYRRGMLGVHPSKRNYPVTRTVTGEGEPLGWVEITNV
jgi:CRISPR-associated protein Csm5